MLNERYRNNNSEFQGAGKQMENKTFNSKLIYGSILAGTVFFLGFIGLIIHTQITFIDELKNERADHLLIEKKNSEMNRQITEKLMDKTSESYQAAITTLTNVSRDQQDSIKNLNAKIEVLMKNRKNR
jgi:hypothetical protein